jgi:hypothetical protein
MRVVYSRAVGSSTESHSDSTTRVVVGDRGIYVKRQGNKAFVIPMGNVAYIEPWGDDSQKDEVPDWLWNRATTQVDVASKIGPPHNQKR